jgi:hypothetical protein
MGEKDVAVPFTAVKHTTKDGKVYLTLDITKDALEAARGLKYEIRPRRPGCPRRRKPGAFT